MFLIHPIFIREQALDVVVRAQIPAFIPLLLLGKDFCRQRCRVCVLDVAFWLLALVVEGFFGDISFFGSNCLLPFLACTGGFL